MRLYNAIFMSALAWAATAMAVPEKDKKSLNEELAGANAVPYRQPGRGVIGYRLTSDPPLGSRLETLGVQSGDVVVGVNDKQLASPPQDKDKAARADSVQLTPPPAERSELKSLFEGNEINKVRVRRDGRELELSFRNR